MGRPLLCENQYLDISVVVTLEGIDINSVADLYLVN